MDLPELPDKESVYIVRATEEFIGRRNDTEYLLIDGTLTVAFWHINDKQVAETEIPRGGYTFVGIGYYHGL